MLSSTSNSDRAWPEGPWLKTWLLAIALALAAVAGWEAELRHLGHRPTIVDDDALWASQRDRVYTTDGRKPIVLIGDCRIQLGLVPQVLRNSLPGRRIVQLAIQETSPIATLRDLAADPRFDGIVICGLDSRQLCKDMWDTQQRYVAYYHTAYHWNARVNRFLSTLMQKTLVSLHPRLRLSELTILLARGKPFPAPYYLETHADRSRLADYGGVDLEAHRKWALDRTHWLSNDRQLPGVEEWLHDAMEVEEWVGTIQARGGRVVFMRPPTSGQVYDYEEFIFPKAMFWDAFAARTSALCIHFKDVPQLAGFDCPDTVHLDRADAPRFTRELGKTLVARDLLGEPTCAVASEHAAAGSASHHRHKSGVDYP